MLICFSLAACTSNDQPKPTDTNLEGKWFGDYDTQQVGACQWNGQPLTAAATFQVMNNSVTATVNYIAGQSSVPVQFTGTLNGNKVNLSQVNNAACDGVPRTYTNRFEGSINGNTLTLVSQDTVCPAQSCIFRRTLKLIHQ
ncbi:hypothetical protein GCM10028805_54390 [Spirosoma harenae]